MNNFKFGNKPGSRKDFPRKNFGGGGSRRLSLHDAVCDECGKNCQVPFKPSGGKPIFCRDCFEKKGGRNGGRDPRKAPQNSISDRRASELIEKIEALNKKLETIIKLLSSAGDKKLGLAE